jgi:hypothetical protein
VGCLLFRTFWHQPKHKCLFREFIRRAAHTDDVYGLMFMVDIGCDLRRHSDMAYKTTPLAVACKAGNIVCVRYILNLMERDDVMFADARPHGRLNFRDRTALCIAINANRPRVVKLLLNDVRVQELPETALSFAYIFNVTMNDTLDEYKERRVMMANWIMQDHPFLKRVPLKDLNRIKFDIVKRWDWAIKQRDVSIALSMLPFIRTVTHLGVEWVGRAAFRCTKRMVSFNPHCSIDSALHRLENYGLKSVSSGART